MTKGKRGRIQKRMDLAGVDERLKDRIPVNYSFPSEPLPDVAETERQLATEFPNLFPDIVKQWSQLLTLHRILIERRATLEDNSELRVALDLLGSKAFADARAAQVLLQQGYAMASLGPLRAATEAADLMDYLLRSPAEAKLWLEEDKKFDRLDWIRKELPVDPSPWYEFLNWGMHANWRFIPQLMRKEGSPLDTHYEIIPGPTRNETFTELLSGAAIFAALKIIALLHDQHRDLVHDVWRTEYRSCLGRNKETQERVHVKVKETAHLLSAFAEITAQAQEGD